MFVYFCKDCGSPATKPPVEVYKANDTSSTKSSTGGSLGTWKCTGNCKGTVKVKRIKK